MMFGDDREAQYAPLTVLPTARLALSMQSRARSQA